MLQTTGQGENTVQKSFSNSDVGIQKQRPFSSAEPASFIGGTSETAVFTPPS
jgi:hypothetical protein